MVKSFKRRFDYTSQVVLNGMYQLLFSDQPFFSAIQRNYYDSIVNYQFTRKNCFHTGLVDNYYFPELLKEIRNSRYTSMALSSELKKWVL